MKRAKFLSPSLSQKHINFARNSVFGAAVVKGRRIVCDFVISSKDLTQPHPNTPGIMQSAARVGIIKLIWQCAVSLSLPGQPDVVTEYTTGAAALLCLWQISIQTGMTRNPRQVNINPVSSLQIYV